MARHSFGALGAGLGAGRTTANTQAQAKPAGSLPRTHFVSKASVNYRHGSKEFHCGNCAMYADHKCSLVAGVIDPQDVCDRWEAKGTMKGSIAQKTFDEAGSSQEAYEHYGAPQSKSSPTRKIQLIRHGATALNNDDVSIDRIRGWKDVPLSPEGAQEAHRLADIVCQQKPDAIVTSDLNRSHETAKIIADKCKTPITQISKVFRPWNVGSFAGKKSSEAVPIIADYAHNKPDEKLPGDGESFNDFKARFFKGLHSTLAGHRGLVAVVTHHRNERLLHAWRDAGFPADGDIHKPTFTQKGEPTAHLMHMDIPVDRLASAARAGAAGAPEEHKRATLRVPEGHSILKKAKQAPDGEHYIPDPQAPGKYLKVQ